MVNQLPYEAGENSSDDTDLWAGTTVRYFVEPEDRTPSAPTPATPAPVAPEMASDEPAAIEPAAIEPAGTGPASNAPSPAMPEPTLPEPSLAAAADLWRGVEADPHSQFRFADVAPRRPGVWMLPTRGPRALVTLGCIGGVFTTAVLLVVLLPAFETGDSRGFLIPLDENRWFTTSLVVSSFLSAIGWLWWTLSASFNAERIVPLSTSPWLPTFVYLGGPIISLVGADLTSDMSHAVVVAGLVWLALGHIAVVASFRATATRIGASTRHFTQLMWLPLAWVSYRMGLTTFLSFFEEESSLTPFLVVVGCLGLLFPAGLVVASWNAMASFERSCRRLNMRTLGVDLPLRDLFRHNMS